MQPREKLLAIGLAATVGLWQGARLLNSFVLQPLDQQRNFVNNQRDTLGDRELAQEKLKRTTKSLAELNARSLPPNPSVASSLYQNWLIEIATKAGLSDLVVTPGRHDAKPKENAYYSIPATVKATGTLPQVAAWLYEFYGSGLLQRVNSIVVTSDDKEGNPVLDVTISVEGLSLVGAPARTTLFAATKPATPLVQLPPQSDLPALTNKNLFVRGYNGPPPPPAPPTPVVTQAPPPPRDTFDPSAYVYLVAVINKDRGPEAWLYDRGTNTQTTLETGKPFRVAGVEGSVVTFGKDWIDVDVAGQRKRLSLGRPLKDIAVSASAAAAAPPATPAPGG